MRDFTEKMTILNNGAEKLPLETEEPQNTAARGRRQKKGLKYDAQTRNPEKHGNQSSC